MDQPKDFFDSIKSGDMLKVKELLDRDASLVNQKTGSALSAVLVYVLSLDSGKAGFK